MKLSELALQLGLDFACKDDRDITGVNSLEEAGESEVSFFSNPKYAHLLKTTRAGAIIAPVEAKEYIDNCLISENPYFDFARTGFLFARAQGEARGISSRAEIDSTAVIGEGCVVYPFAFIGPRVTLGANCKVFPGVYIGEDSVIGDNSILYPNAVLMQGVILGESCVIYPGAVLGADGFGYIRLGDGIQDIPQTGGVKLGNQVVIGSNSCVDKAHIGTTRIGDGSKVDNLVQIGHNVHIGEQALIVSQVGIAGSTNIGDRVTIAGQAGLAGHITIGDDVTIGAQAGIPSDIPSGVIGSGTPFMDKSIYARYLIVASKIPELFKRVGRLEKKLSAGESSGNGEK